MLYTCIHVLEGVALIVHACRTPLNQLYRRFWLHERQRPIKFSDDGLSRMDVRYCTQEMKATFDLADRFAHNFQLPYQRHILDFLTHTKLNCYSSIVEKTCIEYLSSVATGKPKNYSLTKVTAVIDISKD